MVVLEFSHGSTGNATRHDNKHRILDWILFSVLWSFNIDMEMERKKILADLYQNPRYAGAIGLAQIGLDMKIRARMAKKKPEIGKSSHDEIEPEGDGFFKKAGKWMWDKTKNFVKDF